VEANTLVAIAELAKACGIASAVPTACRTFESLSRPAAEALGRLVGTKLHEIECRNQIAVIVRVEAELRRRGLAPRALPDGFVKQVLDSAGYADDPQLQQRWADLLVRCVENDRFAKPLYVDTLRRLSSDDARALHLIFGLSAMHYRSFANRTTLPQLCKPTDRAFIESFLRLHGLGLVEGAWDGPEPALGYPLQGRVSALGRLFHEAVTEPDEDTEIESSG
jgi:hypothetical protein